MLSGKQALSIILLLELAFVAGCNTGEAGPADEAQAALPVPVEVARPERTDLYETYETTGTMTTDRSASVLARVGGEIVDILVEEGERVEAGQTLARLDGERLRLEMLSARAELERARGEYARHENLHARGLISASMYDSLRFDVEALQAAYELAALNYDYSNIRATIPGVVTARHVKAGQTLAPEQAVFDIADTRELVAYLQVPQSEIGKFDVGDRAELAVDSMPDTRFQTTIARLSPTIDTRNGSFRATAIIDNSRGLLAPGMFARFTIAHREHPGALTVPAEAIVEEDGQTVVYVVRQSAVERRTVETGIQYNASVEILDGLDGDELVVVVGQSSLKDGTRVLAQLNTAERFTG